MRQYAQSLTGVALAAAERIIGKQLEREPELLVRWTDDALRSTRAATRLTVAVHPETLAHLGPAFDRLLASPDLPEETIVQADESVAASDVVVRQHGGQIEAGLTAQLARLEDLLT
jgi:flagellar assembly protein FliH